MRKQIILQKMVIALFMLIAINHCNAALFRRGKTAMPTVDSIDNIGKVLPGSSLTAQELAQQTKQLKKDTRLVAKKGQDTALVGKLSDAKSRLEQQRKALLNQTQEGLGKAQETLGATPSLLNKAGSRLGLVKRVEPSGELQKLSQAQLDYDQKLGDYKGSKKIIRHTNYGDVANNQALKNKAKGELIQAQKNVDTTRFDIKLKSKEIKELNDLGDTLARLGNAEEGEITQARAEIDKRNNTVSGRFGRGINLSTAAGQKAFDTVDKLKTAQSIANKKLLSSNLDTVDQQKIVRQAKEQRTILEKEFNNLNEQKAGLDRKQAITGLNEAKAAAADKKTLGIIRTFRGGSKGELKARKVLSQSTDTTALTSKINKTRTAIDDLDEVIKLGEQNLQNGSNAAVSSDVQPSVLVPRRIVPHRPAPKPPVSVNGASPVARPRSFSAALEGDSPATANESAQDTDIEVPSVLSGVDQPSPLVPRSFAQKPPVPPRPVSLVNNTSRQPVAKRPAPDPIEALEEQVWQHTNENENPALAKLIDIVQNQKYNPDFRQKAFKALENISKASNNELGAELKNFIDPYKNEILGLSETSV